MTTKKKKANEKKKELELEIKIPEGVEINVEENIISVKGKKGELSKKFKPQIKIIRKENSLLLKTISSRRVIKALLGTTKAEIENMIKGVTIGIVYKLRAVYSHFPMSLKVQNKKLIIENFLGEKSPRIAEILGGVDVEIKGKDIELRGIDKEKVGQTAANIEQTTKIKDRDRRVFQDGIYIYEKDGKSLLD